MAPSVTWLHLSDLHACNPRTGWDAADVLVDLEKDLVRLRETQELSPDLIFFTGDAGFGHLGTGEGRSLAEQLDEAESSSPSTRRKPSARRTPRADRFRAAPPGMLR